jgi:DNA (cytosine-5)-methyltransferase 1
MELQPKEKDFLWSPVVMVNLSDIVVSKDRFGLVTIKGVDYQIVDIGMRMLEPHELFAAQGFPINYIIDKDYTGKPYPKTAQVARCGNAVPPPFAEALVRANLLELCEGNGKFREVG